ncbi:hypothetical protein SAMN06265338_1333 [Rhodoblastus acidophilus]|uniref:Uncharacterized protein n=1 Tax=Rhodoblastus acidophilus TaxID=1074 RepID=A0A212SF57_RHOAC|nr:hypothetical protein [Rhodoblastus acidophilus]PPQ34945.1 hypothetical protein CKO16_21520 [Rhodoblastus acidophilus]RAI16775.1 hypothetical protein CH337_19585 [Rhodoblastus acidophilus]SNB84114.1 hypothetical protein SAMN06265338_1333 [Rhodoblastus acidophilus]
MSLIENLNLGKGCKLSLRERAAIVKAEKAKVKQIADAMGADELDYMGMTAREVAEEILAGANHEPKPGSLHELHGGNAYFWRTFGSKEALVAFLTPFLATDAAHDSGDS